MKKSTIRKRRQGASKRRTRNVGGTGQIRCDKFKGQQGLNSHPVGDDNQTQVNSITSVGERTKAGSKNAIRHSGKQF